MESRELKRTYFAIDLKSFYASVECVLRGLDPLRTNLVVADVSLTSKTICLAVSPPLKKYGLSGRSRLFEVEERVREVNAKRRAAAPNHSFVGKSCDADELAGNPALELDFIAARPQMSLYMKRSVDVYEIYKKYISPDDIHVYSIDEVFIDATGYLSLYGVTAHELARRIIRDIYETTGISATAGIGENLYLAKVAMDIVAKHIPADADGVRIAELDEISYREALWGHRPITDFWRVGGGYARRLESMGLYTMGDIARCSMSDAGEEMLYREFGVMAELLVDHAWGWEPCEIADIKAYRPESSSISSGQVLREPYSCKKARLIVREMADALSMELFERGLLTSQIVLTVGYDAANTSYDGDFSLDRYGRRVPKSSHGSENLGCFSHSTSLIASAATKIFDRVTNPELLIRRINIAANDVVTAGAERENPLSYRADQLDIFADGEAEQKKLDAERAANEKEERMQGVISSIRKKYGKNSLVKGMNLEEGATGMSRNEKIGGHRA
ncbi:MAG: DNA methylase [Clostridiales bacterium]|nr:DNA methylase [Clostridiales bacterium]